jgi:hypothetical protein
MIFDTYSVTLCASLKVEALVSPAHAEPYRALTLATKCKKNAEEEAANSGGTEYLYLPAGKWGAF